MIVPKALRYNFSKEFTLKCSEKCCYKLKKDVARKWEKENNRSIVITGMRKAEGGNRNNINCIVTDKDNKITKFHPLAVVSNDFIEEFIKKYNVKLCKLYLPPYNYKRTGCKFCPFALDLQEQLDNAEKYLPNEYKQAHLIWGKVFDEYKRINYRLKKVNSKQLTLFENISQNE